MSNARARMIQRAALEIKAGMTVNLGIGLPTRITDYLSPDLLVCLHSENGISGVGPTMPNDEADPNLIDAGGAYVSTLPGSAFFDSATSFALVRRGRIDLTVLGAFQMSVSGDLANWIIPGKFTPGTGGAMELAQKSRRVIALTTHLEKNGAAKIVRECTLPLTAPHCVSRIYSDMAVIDITDDGMVLREVAEGLTAKDVLTATDAPLHVPEGEMTTF